MEFITAAVLSGFLYDMVKQGTALTAENLRIKLRGWILDDITAEKMEDQLNQLEITDELSQVVIERRLNKSSAITQLLAEIKRDSATVVTQYHSGTGDNVAGNKTINN